MDKREISATPESYHTSTLTPIILSESLHVQMLFEGQQVDNIKDKRKNIKGKLIIKKKSKNDSFSDEAKFSKKDIHINDCVEISLDTSETFELGKGLFHYFQLFSGRTTNPYQEVTYVEKDDQLERVKRILEGDERLWDIIPQINIHSLNAALNIENLKRVQKEMFDNLQNDNETSFWQPFFEKNAWILSQLFHAPVMFFQGKRYVGGKGMENHGGQYTDFIYKNDVTDNIALIEIKTPVKAIISKSYRQSFVFSEELVGGVNQLLMQKDTLIKSYEHLLARTDEFYRANNVECYLVYGNVSTLSRSEKDAFENYRNELRSIHIIGFDELLRRVDNLLKLLEGHPDLPPSHPEQVEDGLPF